MDRVKVKMWLVGKGMKQREIARALGVSESFVSKAIGGLKRSEKVVGYLAENGCPKKFLN